MKYKGKMFFCFLVVYIEMILSTALTVFSRVLNAVSRR